MNEHDETTAIDRDDAWDALAHHLAADRPEPARPVTSAELRRRARQSALRSWRDRRPVAGPPEPAGRPVVDVTETL